MRLTYFEQEEHFGSALLHFLFLALHEIHTCKACSGLDPLLGVSMIWKIGIKILNGAGVVQWQISAGRKGGSKEDEGAAKMAANSWSLRPARGRAAAADDQSTPYFSEPLG